MNKHLLCRIGLHRWTWIPKSFGLREYCPRSGCGKVRRAVPGLWGWKAVGWADKRTLEKWIEDTKRESQETVPRLHPKEER